MLSCARRLLTCAAALAALVHAQEQCDVTQIGQVSGNAYNLEEQLIEADTFTLEISEPDACSDSEPVGLKVTACDSAQVPKIYLVDNTHGLVVREGRLETTAIVYITVFCSTNSDEALNESSESLNPTSRMSLMAYMENVRKEAIEKQLPGTFSPQHLNWPYKSVSMLTPSTLSKSPQSDPKTEDSLPPIQLKSRFSSLPIETRPITPSSGPIASRGKDLQFSLPPLEKSNRPTALSPNGLSGTGNEPSFPDQSKNSEGQLSEPHDSYSSFLNKLPSPYSKEPMPIWFKRPSSTSLTSKGQQLSGLLSNRPKLPTTSPSLTWLKQASPTTWSTRKSLLLTPKRPSGRSFDETLWRVYDEDELTSQWSEDSYPWWMENQQVANPVSGGSWRNIIYPQSRSPPISSATHLPNNQLKHTMPHYEEVTSNVIKWKDSSLSSVLPNQITNKPKRLIIPKLLLLLQEQDHSLAKVNCPPVHSVEDGESWWPYSVENTDNGLVWPPEYSSDYSADDGDPRSSYDTGRYIKDAESWTPKQVPLQVVSKDEFSSMSEWSDNSAVPLPGPASAIVKDYQPPRCQKCPTIVGHTRALYNKDVPTHMTGRPPVDYNSAPLQGNHNQAAVTEHPLLSSTTRSATDWGKSLKLGPSKKTNLTPGEQPEHLASSAPWSFLSKLLLSHPSFRESTHVIRI